MGAQFSSGLICGCAWQSLARQNQKGHPNHHQATCCPSYGFILVADHSAYSHDDPPFLVKTTGVSEAKTPIARNASRGAIFAKGQEPDL